MTIMTITSKSTDSQSHELSLTELDQVSGGNLSKQDKTDLVVAVATVAFGPLFLASYMATTAIIQAAK